MLEVLDVALDADPAILGMFARWERLGLDGGSFYSFGCYEFGFERGVRAGHRETLRRLGLEDLPTNRSERREAARRVARGQ